MNRLATLSLRSSDTSPTCDLPTPLAPIPTEPIVGSKDFYHVNIIVSGALALFSITVVLALIWRHATNMSRPREQLLIIRICLLLPIFAVVFWVGVYIPQIYVYLYSIVVICEPVALTCFFLFICETLAAPPPTSTTSSPPPSPSHRDIFLSPLVTQAQRLGVPITDRRVFDGFRRNWIGVAQSIPVAWAVAILTIITQAAGVYCLTAHDAHHSHIYLIVVKTVSTFTALLAVLRTTLPVREAVKEHKAMTKLWAFKALIFLQVAQDFIFSIIDSQAPASLTNSKTISKVDFITGIPSLVVEIELVIFALFFHYAYSVKTYQLSDTQKRMGKTYTNYGWGLFFKIFDIRDVFALITFAFRLPQEVEAHSAEMHALRTTTVADANTRVSEVPRAYHSIESSAHGSAQKGDRSSARAQLMHDYE